MSRGIYHANFTRGPTSSSTSRAPSPRAGSTSRREAEAVQHAPVRRRRDARPRWLALVGEAAGIDATTGEGIAQAILMGGIAARHLARALRRGDGRDSTATRATCSAPASAAIFSRARGSRGASTAREAPLGAGSWPRSPWRARRGPWYTGSPLGWRTKVRLGARSPSPSRSPAGEGRRGPGPQRKRRRACIARARPSSRPTPSNWKLAEEQPEHEPQASRAHVRLLGVGADQIVDDALQVELRRDGDGVRRRLALDGDDRRGLRRLGGGLARVRRPGGLALPGTRLEHLVEGQAEGVDERAPRLSARARHGVREVTGLCAPG